MKQQLGVLLQAQQHARFDEPLRVGQEREEEYGAVGLARHGRDATVQGCESEWIDWKFRFLNAVGSGSLTMRKVMTFAEQNTKKGQGATYDEVIQRPDALPGPNDDWVGTCAREGRR